MNLAKGHLMKASARFFLPSLALGLLSFSGCDTRLGLDTQFAASQQTEVRATILSTATGQVLSLPDPSVLPKGLQTATEIYALLDNSNTPYPVARNADGSLAIPLPAGRAPSSDGKIGIILTDENKSTYFLLINTGPLLRLGDPAIQVSPKQGILPGSRVELALNPAQTDTDLGSFRFNWSVAATAQGPFTPISGSTAKVSWDPPQAGNYYLRVETVDTRTQASTLYTSSVALVNVSDSRRIATSDPVSGSIRLGQLITLKAALPESAPAKRYLWSYSLSPVGPFQPISEEGAQISWEPKLAGSYYLRIQAYPSEGAASTYTSSEAMVLVSEADNAISTDPASGSLVRGEEVKLTAVPPTPVAGNASYRWFYSSSQQGPFSPISGETQTIAWSPEQTGEFYLRVRIFDPQTQEERTFTGSKVLVSVRDSNDSFELSPQPASLIRGQSVQIKLKQPNDKRSVAWFYAPSQQGPFTSIAAQGNQINWSPSQSGSYYLRAELSGDNRPKSIFTSATSLVTVAEGSNVIQLEPNRSISLGESLGLNANTPLKGENLLYTWSYGLSPVGPWLAAQGLNSNPQSKNIQWSPPQSGSFYLKVDVADPASATRMSFVSPTALAFVTDTPSFFQTSPTPATVSTQGAVTLSARFTPPSATFIYAWSYGLSPTGPFTAIGGSQQPQITWKQPGVAGNYYIKFDAIDTSSQRSLSFVSANPLVFVSESQTSLPRF
jgi:hypothetical protein